MFRFFSLAHENWPGYNRDQCCHLQGDGASLWFFEESGQWLEYVVLASGQLVLQKSC